MVDDSDDAFAHRGHGQQFPKLLEDAAWPLLHSRRQYAEGVYNDALNFMPQEHGIPDPPIPVEDRAVVLVVGVDNCGAARCAHHLGCISARVDDAAEALQAFSDCDPDLIVLDVSLTLDLAVQLARIGGRRRGLLLLRPRTATRLACHSTS